MRVITIGRAQSNDRVITDPCASRHHLQVIQHDDGHFTLSDFGSTNGTFVNGQKISGEIPLKDMDIVRIGNTTIPWRIYFEDADIPQEKYPPQASNSPATKKRHGFVTFWLWLMILANVGGAISQIMTAQYAIWQYATDENAQTFFYVKHGIVDYYSYALYFMILLSLVNMAGAIVLLNWRKLGYWLFVGSAAVCMALMISFGLLGGFTYAVIVSLVGAIFGPVVLWAILQIKKNSISCWKLLE